MFRAFISKLLLVEGGLSRILDRPRPLRWAMRGIVGSKPRMYTMAIQDKIAMRTHGCHSVGSSQDTMVPRPPVATTQALVHQEVQ